jgi:hypothetical protein
MVQFVLPVPVLAVVPAGIQAAGLVSKSILGQSPTNLTIKGSLLRLIGYPVTIKMRVWGVDGAANVMLEGSSFGLGPIVGRTKRIETEEYRTRLIEILQQWSAAGAFNQPGPAPTPAP